MGIDIGGNIFSARDFNPSGQAVTPTVSTRGLVLWLDAGDNSSFLNSSNYYDCGYGCQYYSSNPGCTNCNTQWKDISGYGNDWTKNATYSGTHMTFNSTSMSRSASSDWLMTTDCTIDTWFYPASGGINTGCCQTIFGRYWFRFFMIGQGIYTMIGFNTAGTYTYQHPAYTISYDTWHHVVGMRRSNRYIIWIDGVEMYNTDFGSGLTLFSPNETWYISDSSHSNVGISSVKIYNRGISDQEILNNYNSGRNRFGV